MENKAYHFLVVVKGSDFELSGFYWRIEENLIAAELNLRDLLKHSFGEVEILLQHISTLDKSEQEVLSEN